MIFFLASLFVLQALALTKTYNVQVINNGPANGTANYEFNFIDGQAAGLGINPTLTVNVGDTLSFNVSGLDTTGNIFAVHTINNPGVGNVDRYDNSGSENNDGVFTVVIGADATVLYYVSEFVGATNASGTIIVTNNCSDVPSAADGSISGGNCVSNAVNSSTCTPTCSTGFTGTTLSAICVNGAYQVTGTCAAVPAPPTPTPTPTPVTPTPTPNPSPSPSPSPSSGSNDTEVIYIFTIQGTSTHDCQYMQDTVVAQLNADGQASVANSDSSFEATLDCNDNSKKRAGSTWTITVVIQGHDADSVVGNSKTFGNQLQTNVESSGGVTVTSVGVQRESSGFFLQASLFALLAVVLTAISV